MSKVFGSAAIGVVMVVAGLRWAAAATPGEEARAGFTDVTKESGVAEMMAKHEAYMAGKLGGKEHWWLSGFTLVDVEGRGVLDLHLGGHGQQAVMGRNDGKGNFAMVELKAEVARGPGKKGEILTPGGEVRMVMDLDEDGKQDLLISYHDNGGVTYLNGFTGVADEKLAAGAVGGGWKFRPVEVGFEAFSRAAAFVDLNRDGLVDYLETGDEGRNGVHPLHVYLGQGGGKWKEGASVTVLKEAGAIPCDINGDGFVDLLVSQRGYNDSKRWILINDGKMGFKNFTMECGLEEAGSIMGVGDVNQDGSPDLICVEQEAGGKGLGVVMYLNDGKGKFVRGAAVVGMAKAPRPSTGNWGGAVVTDFDNDGVADVAVNGKGFLYFLHGLGGGKLEYVNERWHLPADIHPAVDEGLCFGDIDGDGMLDVVTCGRGPAEGVPGVVVLRNDLAKRHWLNVQVVGKKGNRAGAGSVIRVMEAGKLLWYEQVCIWGRQSFQSYYAAAETERHFGLGERVQVDVSVEFYPSGKKVEKKGVKSDGVVVVAEGE